MSTAVVAASTAAGAAAQPFAGASGQMASGNSKPWWLRGLRGLRNGLVVSWLLFVYVFCLMQAINTMVALNAQQEISAIVAPNDTGSAPDGDTGKSSAKTQLDEAMFLLDELRVLKSSGNGSPTILNDGTIRVGAEQKRATLKEKFGALPPEIQKAAIEAEAGVGWDGIGYVFMPMAMVTLMMSLWMGALGGAIHMTVEFLRKDEAKSGAWFFFRPFHGALLALAVFIIFQAGQIVLTNPVPGGNAGLNPYVIAFVAIVSGMLTDQAYRRIGLAGSQFLGAKADEKPRWARPSVVQDKLANRTAADLTRHIPGTLDATVQAWLDGSKELSEGEQTVLAAWLDAEPRELFTDQPPAPKAEEPATNTPGGTRTPPDRADAPEAPEKAETGSGEANEPPEGTVDPGADQERSEAPAPAAVAEEHEGARSAAPGAGAPSPEKRAA